MGVGVSGSRLHWEAPCCLLRSVSMDGWVGRNGIALLSLIPRAGVHAQHSRRPSRRANTHPSWVPSFCHTLPSPCLCPSCLPARKYSSPVCYLRHSWDSKPQNWGTHTVQTQTEPLGGGSHCIAAVLNCSRKAAAGLPSSSSKFMVKYSKKLVPRHTVLRRSLPVPVNRDAC